MRKIREVLRRKAADVSNRKIADAIGCSRSSVERCLKRAAEAGIGFAALGFSRRKRKV